MHYWKTSLWHADNTERKTVVLVNANVGIHTKEPVKMSHLDTDHEVVKPIIFCIARLGQVINPLDSFLS